MGFGLCALCVLASGFASWRVAAALTIAYAGSPQAIYLYPALAAVPPLLALLLAGWLALAGKTRSALGVLLGLGAITVSGLLLVAACGWLMAGPGRLQF